MHRQSSQKSWFASFTKSNRIDRSRGVLITLFAFLALCMAAVSQESTPNTAYQAELERLWKLHPTLALGSPAPDFNLIGVDGKKHSLSEYKDSKLLAIIFTCPHCPAAQLYEDRIKKMVDEYRPKGVAFVAIQPNAPAAAAMRELNYTDVDDSLEGMIIRAKHRNFNFPFLYDGDTQEVVEKYGPKATPHAFVFDEARKLQFEGRIDDNMRPEAVKTHDLRNALDALLSGQPVAVPHTAVFGCATKWISQIEGKQKENKQLESLPVKLEVATAEELKKLRTNPTGKLLMINFWATWCGPCVEEFPDLLKTYFWYRSRGFELVTVSTDVPEAKDAVMKFLEKERSVVRNLQFASEDTYGLQAAFDPKWESGVPFTIVIAPDGKVIYRAEGEVNLLELRRTILANLPDGGYPGNAAYWAKK
jgi:thiol-disulfide isomerase/thioredoxin